MGEKQLGLKETFSILFQDSSQPYAETGVSSWETNSSKAGIIIPNTMPQELGKLS